LIKFKWEWVITSIVMIILFLSLLTPLLGLTFAIIAIPMIILIVRTNLKFYFISFVASQLIIFILYPAASLYIMIVSLFFVPSAIVMGRSFIKNTPASQIISSGTMIFIAQFLFILLVAYFRGLNPIESFKQYLNSYFELTPQIVNLIIPDGSKELLIQNIISLIPFYIIVFSLALAFVGYLISRKILNKLGENISGLSPIREWMLPKFIVWLYVIALVLNLITPVNVQSSFSAVIFNLLSILTIAFTVQAISFTFFVAHLKKWKSIVPILVIALCFLPLLNTIFSLLGIIDISFPVRDKLKKKLLD
jgi:uncharacterized protein YybS (DUF2232 family)